MACVWHNRKVASTRLLQTRLLLSSLALVAAWPDKLEAQIQDADKVLPWRVKVDSRDLLCIRGETLLLAQSRLPLGALGSSEASGN